MDKRPQLSAKNKTDLMPNNASCKRWDTPFLTESVRGGIEVTFELGEREFRHELFQRVAGISFTYFSRVTICVPGSLP